MSAECVLKRWLRAYRDENKLYHLSITSARVSRKTKIDTLIYNHDRFLLNPRHLQPTSIYGNALKELLEKEGLLVDDDDIGRPPSIEQGRTTKAT